MNAVPRLLLVLALLFGLVPFAPAQPAAFRHQLVALVPDDFAVCVVMNDLRGHAARWERADWLKGFRASAVGKTLLNAPEVLQIERVQADLKKHLDLDWATIRDDILGDTLVLAHFPPRDKPDEERGLILLHVRRADRLQAILDKMNDTPKVKVTTQEHKGQGYIRRVEGAKTQYYSIKDSIAAVSSSEAVLQSFLERRANPPAQQPWKARFERAGAESAFVTMSINPRLLDAEILKDRKKTDPLPGYWQGLEAIFVTLTLQDEAELRIAIQANVERMPDWARGAFVQTTPASKLWRYFPQQSILTLASRTDFNGVGDAMKVLVPEKDRKNLDQFQDGIGKLLRIDLGKDILPNIGPDWGVCVLPSKDAKQLPLAMFALAVKPGEQDQAVDRLLFTAVELFAGFAVRDYNKNNPNTPIRVETVKQGKVEVKYLANAKLFPPGFQPACALKDGFLVFATSPEAITHFQQHDRKPDGRKDTPLVRISAPELAKLLDHRREHILAGLTAEKMPPHTAKKNLEDVIGLLGLFDQLSLSQHGEGSQASWILRLTPARGGK